MGTYINRLKFSVTYISYIAFNAFTYLFYMETSIN